MAVAVVIMASDYVRIVAIVLVPMTAAVFAPALHYSRRSSRTWLIIWGIGILLMARLYSTVHDRWNKPLHVYGAPATLAAEILLLAYAVLTLVSRWKSGSWTHYNPVCDCPFNRECGRTYRGSHDADATEV